ncbi:hypothetical protein [Serratia sarumanii]|uniref:hypothetical protein n=1 Tax=Serratia sarumanii TaxID=3020826 RepID=UPI003F7ED40C
MTITHQTIKEEAAEFKSVLFNNEIEIPSFMSCAWPAMALMMWLILWPVIAFQMKGNIYIGTLMAISISGFAGFLFSIAFFNARSLYLAIPPNFRNKSKVLNLLRCKVKIYLLIFFVMNILGGCWAENSEAGAMLYLFVTIGAMVILAFVFAADISRYRLSAFTSVLELIKSRKQGGE